MINKKALRTSIIVMLVEVAIFLLICLIGSSDQNGAFSWKQFFANIMPQLTNMFIAVATTWYVIFTFYILASYEQSRKTQSEPYVRIEWENSAEKSINVFDNHDELSKQFSRNLNISPRDVDREVRYVNLKVVNCRPKKLGKLSLKIHAKAEIAGRIFSDSNMSWSRDNINLGDGETAIITVSDLKAIPRGASIVYNLLDINYFGSDSNTPLNESVGIKEYKTSGIAEFEEIGPKPRLETEETKG